jgi:hypothetical protein
VTEPKPAAAAEKKTDYIKRAIVAAVSLFVLIAALLLIRGFTSGPRAARVKAEVPVAPPATVTATTDAYHKRLDAYRKAGDTPDDVPTVNEARSAEDQHASEEDRRAAEYIRNQLLLPMQVTSAGTSDLPTQTVAPANPAAAPVSPDDAGRYAELQRRITALHQIQKNGGAQ